MRSDRESEINGVTETVSAPENSWKKVLSLLPFHQATLVTDSHDRYPVKLPHRFNTWLWNDENQACYTAEEIKLLQHIRSEYKELGEKINQGAPYFELTQEKSWRELIVCTRPAFKDLDARLESASFTLPNRAGKDTRQYPLWKFAEDMAKQIANWQGMRVKQQKTARMNDPVMLVFEQLRHWFFDDLANTQCKKEDVDTIAAMQSYIKNLIHLIPDFGADRSHLHDIQRRLGEAAEILRTGIANQKLPALLSNIVIAGRSLENAIATYLHFLTDEEVADNCASNYLDGGRQECHASPLCKLYQAADRIPSKNVTDTNMTRFQPLNHFFELTQLSEEDGVTQAQFKLNTQLLPQSQIRFAPFFTEEDKTHYLHAVATLDALVSVRKTLERFHHTQEKVGTYLFALHYQDKATQLTDNYQQLIGKNAGLVKQLLHRMDEGVDQLLRQHTPHRKQYFEKNLRSLETKVVEKGRTASLQLDVYCQKALESLYSYKEEMKKLASDIRSGRAKQDLEIEMQHLFGAMHQLNALLPVVLAPTELALQTNVTLPALPDVATLPHAPPALTANAMSLEPRIDYLKQAVDIRRDDITQQPIYTFLAYKQGKEIGAIQLYGVPTLQLSAQGQHNIVRMSGVFCDIATENGIVVPGLCEGVSAEVIQHWKISLGSAAVNGFLFGGANAIDNALQRQGFSPRASMVAREISYYGALFAWRFYTYCAQDYFYGMSYQYAQAACKASFDIGKLAASNYAFKGMSWMIHQAASFWRPQEKTAPVTSVYFNRLLRFGFFAENVWSRGLPEATATQVVGMAAQAVTEWVGTPAGQKPPKTVQNPRKK